MEGGNSVASDRFEDAFAAHRKRLFGIAFSILRDPVEAEDALQEVAIQAWRGWGGRSDPERTVAWLSTICVRHCLRRRGSLRRFLFVSTAERAELRAATDHVRYDGTAIDMDRAFAKLSRQQRAVIVLHYQQGYTLPECAEQMGCSGGAAASHLSRALAKMRARLGPDAGDADA